MANTPRGRRRMKQLEKDTARAVAKEHRQAQIERQLDHQGNRESLKLPTGRKVSGAIVAATAKHSRSYT